MRMPISKKRGSFCLEITIVFPFVMIIIFVFIWQMSILKCENLLKSLIIKESEKIDFVEIIGSYSQEIIMGIVKEDLAIDESDNLLNIIYETAIKNQINNHFNLIYSSNSIFKTIIKSHNEYFEYDLLSDTPKLSCSYVIYTPFYTVKKNFCVPVRMWSEGDKSGKTQVNENTSIWQSDNFDRGLVIRKRFGGNLPVGFPFLSGFSNNIALLIKSIDLTKETWQNTLVLKSEIYMHIDELKNYSGMILPWGEKQITINPQDIKYRHIKYIIPENTDFKIFENILANVVKYGEINGVNVEIIQYQKSY